MSDERKQTVVEALASSAAAVYRLSSEEVLGTDRDKSIVEARQLVMYLAVKMGLSSMQVGMQFGRRDHTTVLHAKRKIEKKLEEDPQLRARMERIRADADLVYHFLEGAREDALCLLLPEPVRERLAVLVESGCYGETMAAVVERLVAAAAYELVAEVNLVVEERCPPECPGATLD